VQATCADVDALQQAVGFAPNTPVAEGVKRFIEWYRKYHRV
jgi:UDP-glucuronate 4-epimerase